jgi:hypothetical protein
MADVHDQTVEATTSLDMKDHGQYEVKEVEHVYVSAQRPALDEEEVEPELHARTWITLAAFFLLNYTQVVALQGPSAVVSTSDSEAKACNLLQMFIADNLPAKLHWNRSPQY